MTPVQVCVAAFISATPLDVFKKGATPEQSSAVFVAAEPDIFKPRHDAFPILNPTTTSAS